MFNVVVVIYFQGGLLHLNLIGCDGGQKDDTCGPNNIVGAIGWSSAQG